MKVIQDPREFAQLAAGAVSIGNFDGVHLGHARIMQQLRAQAQAAGGPAVAFSFDPHPVRLLRPDQAPLPLTWTNRKADLLAELGVDLLIAYPTDMALLQLTPTEFFRQLIVEQLRSLAIVEGPNFHFGQDRAGDVTLLERLCTQFGVRLEIVPPYDLDGGWVSSSRVRRALAEGQVECAARMLTQPYRVRGMVTHGAARGAKLGFPTANLKAIDTLVPAPGVYAGRAYVGHQACGAAIHIGPNPTFAESTDKVEVHLLDFRGNLYGAPLEVDFLSRLRDIQPFSSVEALIQQLTCDTAAARHVLSSRSG